jgi:[calcium/calmodulin-dependent protein kinase] kinase
MHLVRQEIEIMQSLRHPNLVKLHSVIDDASSSKLYMILEYLQGGTLCTSPTLSDPRTSKNTVCDVDIQRIRSQFLDVLHGLEFLHRRNVVHMDIKPENILLDVNGNCKLADFGVCQVLSDKVEQDEDILRNVQGTPLFFAPEIVQGVPYHGKAADVWALGVTLYIALYQSLPFEGTTLVGLNESITSQELSFPSLHSMCGGPTDELLDVMRRMLCREPELRITVSQAIGHPFFSRSTSIEWGVRLWKEAHFTACNSEEDLLELARRRPIKDNTDRSGQRYVTADVLRKRKSGNFIA